MSESLHAYDPQPAETASAPPAASGHPTAPSRLAAEGPGAAPAAGWLPKSPWFAALLSIMPGLGNVYNGLYLRGVTSFLIGASLIAIAARHHPLFGLAIGFFWPFNMIDAFRQATLINFGYAQDLGLPDRPPIPHADQGGFTAGGILVIIGLFALVDRYTRLDVDFLVDLWPVALILIGAWIVWGSLRERKGQ
jgi:hypothetical protein